MRRRARPTTTACRSIAAATPAFLSHNTCHDGICKNFSSLFFPLTCLRDGDACALDPEAKCVSPQNDMGMVPAMGLGAFGGAAAVCVHGCSSPSDCSTVAANLHIPMTCGTIGSFSACVPMIPDLINCVTSDECFGDLTCEGGGAKAVCTKRCAATADCTGDDALGSNFYCDGGGLCAPKFSSGLPAPSEEACLSGKGTTLPSGAGVTCVSPTGWACALDGQCANGQCVLFAGSDPPFGRCK